MKEIRPIWRCYADSKKPWTEDVHGFLAPQVFYQGAVLVRFLDGWLTEPLGPLWQCSHQHGSRQEAQTCATTVTTLFLSLLLRVSTRSSAT